MVDSHIAVHDSRDPFYAESGGRINVHGYFPPSEQWEIEFTGHNPKMTEVSINNLRLLARANKLYFYSETGLQRYLDLSFDETARNVIDDLYLDYKQMDIYDVNRH